MMQDVISGIVMLSVVSVFSFYASGKTDQMPTYGAIWQARR